MNKKKKKKFFSYSPIRRFRLFQWNKNQVGKIWPKGDMCYHAWFNFKWILEKQKRFPGACISRKFSWYFNKEISWERYQTLGRDFKYMLPWFDAAHHEPSVHWSKHSQSRDIWKKEDLREKVGRNFSIESSIKTTECQYKEKLLSITLKKKSTIGNLKRPLLLHLPIRKDAWLLQEPGLGPRTGLRADIHLPTADTRPAHQATPLFYPTTRKRAGEDEEMQDGQTVLQTPAAGSAARTHGNQHFLKVVFCPLQWAYLALRWTFLCVSDKSNSVTFSLTTWVQRFMLPSLKPNVFFAQTPTMHP